MQVGDNIDLANLRDQIRGRLTMADLCAKDGLEGRREGHAQRARCPFHEEKSGSFLIGGRAADRAHCFGCGWSGDLFAFWEKRKGVSHVEAVNQLASLVGLAPVIPGLKWERPKAKTLAVAKGTRRIEAGEKPALPGMRMLREDEMETLAKLRGLSVESVRIAATVMKRVGYCEWPLYLNRRENRWCSPCDAHWFKCGRDTDECAPVPRFPSWVVTDDARWVAQFRRLDGEPYTPRGEGSKDPFKSWTLGTATWPLGAAELRNRMGVILVEGGADMLAGYHFLQRFSRLREVGVVCMLGASGRIAEAALPFFKGKRVRIICDADEEQVKRHPQKDGTERIVKTRPGCDAAARWTEQLTHAGAAVKTFYLGDVLDGEGEIIVPGLVRADGKPVKDLNDLAYCSSEILDSDEVRDAFCEWKEGFGG